MSLIKITCCTFIGLLSVSCRKESGTEKNNDQLLFKLKNQKECKIDFQNNLTEALNTNILMYEYFYNGGGVAAGDLNGDQLIDLYFTSNMENNKIYLNKGNMVFEDISFFCGAQGREGPWKTGVAMVDINDDNKLDIYLCYSGNLPEEKRQNELFINQGNNVRGIPQFKEMAADYGLNSPGFSTQSYFFDYDLDDDLDMILLNHNPKNLPMLNEESTKALFEENDPWRGTRLFRNTSNKFEDVTIQAGINGSPLSYGLGVGISDINKDGWPDFYLSNDYNVPDYLYINQKNGLFKNELSKYIEHTSQFSMGNDIADINNDGWTDVFTLDMLPEDNTRQKLLLSPDNYNKFELNIRSGFYFQYMRNMLHSNNADGTFSEIGQAAGISNTDWSWSALFQDFDNDGFKDLHISNGYKRDYTNLDFINYMDEYTRQKGKLKREDVMQIVEKMPASDVSNYIFKGSDSVFFTNKTKDWGLERPSNSNGVVTADLDNDGDLDLVVNNINAPAFVYENQSNRITNNSYLDLVFNGKYKGIGTTVEVTTNSKSQYFEHYLQRGYQSSISEILHIGLGTDSVINTLTVKWPGGNTQILHKIKPGKKLILNETDALPVQHKLVTPGITLFSEIKSSLSVTHSPNLFNDFDRQYLLITGLSHTGPFIINGDLNRDSVEDIIYGGNEKQNPWIAMSSKNSNFIVKELPVSDPYTPGIPLVIDINHDGKKDIIIFSTGYSQFDLDTQKYKDYVCINTGNSFQISDQQILPDLHVSKGAVASLDLNEDGLEDIFVGGRCVPGQYPIIPESYILINDGNGKFVDQTNTINNSIRRLGMVCDASCVDINNDHKKDLIVVGEWMSPQIFIQENKKLINKSREYFDQEYKGWWNKIFCADLNGDSRPDFVFGNHGHNSQIRSTMSQPVKMYFKDFDKNGSIDPVLTTYVHDVSYPFITREELLRQMAYLKPKFNSFKSYSDATIDQIFKPTELKDANIHEANLLETSLFLSNSKAVYDRISLPKEVQYSPVYAMAAMDIDYDSDQDLLLFGNDHHFKIRIGQMDANHGVVLKNNGDGNFEYIPQTKSGLKIIGDVRSVVKLNEESILLGINGKESTSYTLTKHN